MSTVDFNQIAISVSEDSMSVRPLNRKNARCVILPIQISLQKFINQFYEPALCKFVSHRLGPPVSGH